MLRLAADGVIGFSTIPLKLVLLLGVFVSGFAFLFGITALLLALFGSDLVPGWASIAVLKSFLAGI